MAMRQAVSCIPSATFSRGRNGNIITFAQFEEGDFLSETCDDAESGEKSDDKSIMPPLISKGEIDTMGSGDESEDEPMYK